MYLFLFIFYLNIALIPISSPGSFSSIFLYFPNWEDWGAKETSGHILKLYSWLSGTKSLMILEQLGYQIKFLCKPLSEHLSIKNLQSVIFISVLHWCFEHKYSAKTRARNCFVLWKMSNRTGFGAFWVFLPAVFGNIQCLTMDLKTDELSHLVPLCYSKSMFTE